MNKYEEFVGKVLDGRYKILELVGMGGMACVLKAQDLVMKRIVAIKILNDEYTGNEAAEARFIDESKAVAMLSNKNIVSVYDVAIYPDIKYIVMEYLDGITLREYLDNKGVIGWKEACIYILQILKALEHAHSKGIIHRDIKPQNVILMKNGDIKVTDFGIAKLPNSVSEQNDEKAVGTVYYISPEQACGKETDFYSDIYSLGVMFYEAVTGTLPFIAETPMEVAMMQVNDEPVHPRDIVLDIPVGVSQIILKAMEKSPEERFQSAHTMVKAIEWVLRYPDVIFNMNSSSAEESTVGNSSVVSIDMISTSELEPYGDDEIADSLDKKKSNEKLGKNGNPVKKRRGLKHKSSKAMFPIICGVSFAFILVAVVLLVIVGVNALGAFINPEQAPEAEFPELVGTYYSEDLKNNLLNGTYGAKFVIDEIIYETRDELENNKIISTEPQGGHLSKVGSDGKVHFDSITVNVSEKVYVPYLAGYPKTTAEAMLSSLQLKVEFVETKETDNPYYSADQIIKTEPAEGTEVKIGDTIKVFIYKGGETGTTARMPNVIGLSESEAIQLAQKQALYKVKVEYKEVIGGNNRVISQSISAGTVSSKNTEVVITISKPLKAVTMPNLVGLTYTDARTEMDNASPENYINLSALYFVVDEAVKAEFEAECAGITDMSKIISILMTYNCEQVFEYDNAGRVIFQDVENNTEIPEETVSINVIVVTYVQTSTEVPDESTDVSDDSSQDASNNESSSDSTSTEDSSSADISQETTEPEISEPAVDTSSESSEVVA